MRGLRALVGREDLRLLSRELLFREDALVLQIGQLLELLDRVRCRRRSRRRRRLVVLLCGGGCSAYCASFWSDQRLACRRETRLETAVAVPATTAVRATPLISPGISRLLFPFSFRFSVRRWRRAGRDVVHRDVARRHQFGPALAHPLHEGDRPPVLEDQDAGRRARPDGLRGIVEVGLIEHPRRRALEDRHVELAVGVEVPQLDPFDRPVVVPRDERQVEDPDQSAVDQIDESGKSRRPSSCCQGTRRSDS